MKNYFYLFSTMMIILSSCSKEKDAHVEKHENLPATVRAHIQDDQCLCGPAIFSYIWQGKKYYSFDTITVPGENLTCDGILLGTVYDSEGVELDLDMEVRHTILKERDGLEKIWVCGN